MDNKCWKCDRAHSTGYFCGYVGTECDEFPGLDFINSDHPMHNGGCDKFVPKGVETAISLLGKELWYAASFVNKVYKDDEPRRSCVQYISVLKDGTVLLHTKEAAFNVMAIGKKVFTSRNELMTNIVKRSKQNGKY